MSETAKKYSLEFYDKWGVFMDRIEIEDYSPDGVKETAHRIVNSFKDERVVLISELDTHLKFMGQIENDEMKKRIKEDNDMADYVCDDCKLSTSAGGKCTRYEKECPFEHCESLSDENVAMLMKGLKFIEEALNILTFLRDEGVSVDFDYVESLLRSAEVEVEELTSSDLLKEWKGINS